MPSGMRAMNESMIERVARAICQMHGDWPDKHDEDGLCEWQNWVDEAQAAIATIRDALPHGVSRTILNQALEDV